MVFRSPVVNQMENANTRKEQQQRVAGVTPQRYDDYSLDIPTPNRMVFRSPVVNQMNPQEKQPRRVSLNKPPSIVSSHRSQRSRAESHIRALELENQNDEAELQASLEQDKIEAERALEELKIKKELQIKAERKKAEFLRKKRERERKIIEIQSGSEISSECSSKSRVEDWVNESVKNHNSNNNPNEQQPFPATNNNPGLNEVLLQAFKALKTRNVKDLPKFTGTLVDWPIFENEFRTSTNEMKITDRENLRRLDRALDGKARSAVAALLSDSVNVGLIMKILKTNFGRTEWVVSNRLEQLRNLDNVKEGNVDSFRTFYNAVVGTSVALKNVKGEAYLLNPELISCLADKLPPFSTKMWCRHKADLVKSGSTVDFQSFLGWLEDEMENQLAGINPSFFSKKQGHGTTGKTKAMLNINAFDGKKESKFSQCSLCKSKEHTSLARCDQFKKLSVEQRRTTARTCKVCYICLKADHNRKRCTLNRTCSVCKKNHHELVHSDAISKPAASSQKDVCNHHEEVSDDSDAASSISVDSFSDEYDAEDLCNVNVRGSNTLLRIGKVRIRYGEEVAEIFALFDEGSTLSMMDVALAKRLKLNGPVSPVTYRWTNGIVHKDCSSMALSFQISGPSPQSKWYDVENVRSCANLQLPQVKFDKQKILDLYPLLDEDKLSAVQNAVPQLLIGSNNAGLIVPLKTIQYSLNGLQLTRCHLGWTIHGRIQPHLTEVAEQFHVFTCVEQQDEELTSLIKKLYKVEDFGITNQVDKMSEEDTRAIDIMNRTLRRCGDHFEVGQLYRYNNFHFPDSKPQALRRLQVMERKMDADSKFAEQYCAKIEDYVNKGYARKLDRSELTETPNTWYLPHFSVVSASKFRLVMDAKAKSHGFSLNDLLLKGPDLVPPLIAVLMRGRKKKVAFVADIKEMFHQVQIRKQDQNSQRFFFRGMNRTGSPDVYVMKAMIFGAVSSPSIAQFIKNFNAKELEASLPGVERAIIEQHYVDDYFDCADTEEEAIELIARVIKAHERGGFKLVKFVSNSGAVLASLDCEARSEEANTTGKVRVLGISWDLRTDEFVFSMDFPNLLEELRSGVNVPTKRQLLKFMMGIFDPLGFLSPVTIHIKILFQELWRLQIAWNDKLPDGLVPRWAQWLEDVKQLNEVRIPRYYFPRAYTFSCVELHAFSDASDKAYACVIYVVFRDRDQAHVALLYAKSRVASLKSQTVPRLELQGCTLASQMMKVAQEELRVEVVSIHFWVDSKICLNWMNTKEKLTAYVGARVTKLKENGHNPGMWHWIPSNLNVADMGTKFSKFANMHEWLQGPRFLYQARSNWPNYRDTDLSPEDWSNFHREIEADPAELCCSTVEETCLELPDINRFSDFNRLIRATAYYLKMRKILALRKVEKPERLTINVQDMEEAKSAWFRKIQLDAFAEEYRSLRARGVVKKSSRLYQLSPFLSDGVIRMRGRIQDQSKPFGENNPVILPDNNVFSKLLIRMYHIANGHQGVETIVNNLRQRYRILKTRSQVKKYGKYCIRCRELRGKPNVAQMGNLPPERTTPFVFPFTCTGIDYFGPLFVKVGRRLEKRWVVLFTCMTSRAVHLEVVPSLNTDSCIMAIRCFMAVRGVPQKILSDNGTNFTGADNELKRLLKDIDHQQLEASLSTRGVEWSFIPPGAPHFGGCWERMVRTVKAAMRGMLKDHHPTDLVLHTTLNEVMNIVNNRPLIPVSNCPQDTEPLTPNMLLLGRTNYLAYDHKFDERDLNRKAAYKHSQIFADRFWRKWVSSYRPELLKRQKWPDNRDYLEYVPGDLVMIVDENMQRGYWLKGVVDEVYRGPDKKVRTVLVRTTKSTYTRPVTKIVLLQATSVAPENVGNTAN